MNNSKRILVAPLNWGLGHATRCIPIIKNLQNQGFTPIIASDGVALALLKKEFTDLTFIELPSYQIQYAKKGKNFKKKLLWDSPKIIKAIAKEKKATKEIVKKYHIDGVISDNRLGVYAKKVPSVFITHQLNVLTGNTSWLSSTIHQKIIKKFSACWVPDVATKPNLSGKLGHLKKHKLNITYLGVLSRLEKKELPKKYDLMVIISGPEPQRSMLEEKLLLEVKQFKGEVLFIKGKIEDQQTINTTKNTTIYNFMNSKELETAFNQSELVLSRSGYTTVMDLAKLEKKAFFIPTPGQFEQEYLAKRLDKHKIAPYASQDDFSIDQLKRIKDYKGLSGFTQKQGFDGLFELF